MQSFESIIGGSAKEVKDIRVKNATRSIQTQSEMDVAKMVQDYRNMQNDQQVPNQGLSKPMYYQF